MSAVRNFGPDEPLRVGLVGAGYFSQYHVDAWRRLNQVDGTVLLVALAEPNQLRVDGLAAPHTLARYPDMVTMLDDVELDVVDIVTPPPTHHELVMAAADRGVHVICQKPLAHTTDEARALVEEVAGRDVRFMVHENWRWQPWYRRMRAMIDDGTTGRPFHASFTMRTGDGWPDDAYLARQPYFRDYPRLLLHETGVHFIDMFRFLLGEVVAVTARISRRNPAIAGEDAAVVMLDFESGATAVYDASRYNELDEADARYTFGTMRLDAERGHAELDTSGEVTWKPLGDHASTVLANPPRSGFGGDCVLELQRHFVDRLRTGLPFESEGADYLRTIEVVEACYRSAESGRTVTLDPAVDRQ